MRVLNNVRRENFPKDFRVYMPRAGNGFLGSLLRFFWWWYHIEICQ